MSKRNWEKLKLAKVILNQCGIYDLVAIDLVRRRHDLTWDEVIQEALRFRLKISDGFFIRTPTNYFGGWLINYAMEK